MKAIEKLKALVTQTTPTIDQLTVSTNGRVLPHCEAVSISQRLLEQIEREDYSRLTVQNNGAQTRITFVSPQEYFILAMAN